MPILACLLCLVAGPKRTLVPKQSWTFRAELRDRTGVSEATLRYDFSFRVVGPREEKRGWPCRFGYANQTIEASGHRFSQPKTFGTLDLVVDETGLAGPLSLLPSDAVMSFPRLAFLLPPSVDDNGDFSMASEPEAAIAWTIAGKWTAEADRKRSRLVGTVAAPNGTARLRFDILLDEYALPLTAVLARRGDDQEAEFTLKRR